MRSFLRTLSALMLAGVIGAIVYLTFQPPVETRSLSHPVYLWFRERGWKWSEHDLRSLAHLPEYFVLGCALVFFGVARGWGWRRILLAGAVMGLADECIKILLPTREFDFRDWTLDVLGILLALLLAGLIKWIIDRRDNRML